VVYSSTVTGNSRRGQQHSTKLPTPVLANGVVLVAGPGACTHKLSSCVVQALVKDVKPVNKLCRLVIIQSTHTSLTKHHHVACMVHCCCALTWAGCCAAHCRTPPGEAVQVKHCYI
jgi:hypothetical protein